MRTLLGKFTVHGLLGSSSSENDGSTHPNVLVLAEIPTNTLTQLKCESSQHRFRIHEAIATEVHDVSPAGQCVSPPQTKCQVDLSDRMDKYCGYAQDPDEITSCNVSSLPEDLEVFNCRDKKMRLTVLYECGIWYHVVGPDPFCGFRRTSRYCR
ncbi:hypothetical protein BV898_17894 [Hypsibius exemplaris]|uniref:Uncharacterized protein n=1 Tax=Hypsibius exemplaris TaxID=2072580 RepID=A0A9X6RN99_HYPEX|nr:hypothetical protein BV898_17894 [Hypsibius exemplaris]